MPARSAITLANSLVIWRGTWKSSTLLELANERDAQNQKNVFYYDYLLFTPFVLVYDMILANTASSFSKCYKIWRVTGCPKQCDEFLSRGQICKNTGGVRAHFLQMINHNHHHHRQWWDFVTDRFPPSSSRTDSHHGGNLSWWEFASGPLFSISLGTRPLFWQIKKPLPNLGYVFWCTKLLQGKSKCRPLKALSHSCRVGKLLTYLCARFQHDPE